MLKRLAMVCVAAIFFVVGAAPAFASNHSIKIGIIGPYSGPAAFDGLAVLRGAKLAVKQINDRGGVLGKQIELLVGDTRAKPSESINVAKKFITQDKVSALICCHFSSSVLATMPVVEKLQTPLITGVSTATSAIKKGWQWFFRSNHNTVMEAKIFVDFWIDVVGVKEAAFLARNDDWGRETIQGYIEVMKARGVKVITEEYARPSSKDYLGFLTKIKAKKPQAFGMVEISSSAAAMVKQMKDLNWKPILLGSDGQVTDEFITLAGDAAEGMYLVTRWEPTIDLPRSRRFVREHKKMFPKASTANQYTQAGYDNVYILADAMGRCGCTDRKGIRDALVKTIYYSVSGAEIFFDKEHQAYPVMYITQVRNGKRVILKKVSTAKAMGVSRP